MSNSWLTSAQCVIVFMLLGFWASLLGSIVLLFILACGYLIKIKVSWHFQYLSALGLLLGVFPLWAGVAWLTSNTATSIIFSVQIILVPILWLLGAWIQARFGHRWWSYLKH